MATIDEVCTHILAAADTKWGPRNKLRLVPKGANWMVELYIGKMYAVLGFTKPTILESACDLYNALTGADGQD